MTDRQCKALNALLANPTKAKAAKAAGISISTLKMYLKDPEFLEAYRQGFNDLIEESTRIAQTLVSPALQTLQGLMNDPSIPAAARISAARILIESAVRLTNETDIIQRLEVLEDRDNNTD